MNIIFCAYRDWAVRVLPTIQKHPNVKHVRHVTDNEDLYRVIDTHEYDLVLFCGWSTPPDEWATEEIPMFSEHPAASDRYSPGTPLQNQILDGKNRTQHRIVKVAFPELSLRQWSHEVDMELSGNMEDILFQMEATSKVLFTRFLDDYPKSIQWKTWDEVPELDQIPRRIPTQSKLEKDHIISMSTRSLYNKIRCLEHPYPNAYIEDDEGILYFEKVSYKAKK